MSPEVPTGWRLLHSALPKAALRELSDKVYGVSGLTDVNEGYLIQRLFASGLDWSWEILKQEFLAAEDREVRDKGYSNRYYLASVQGRLHIDGKHFDGSGASDNRKVDAAFKGAATVAFKNACKLAGMTAELYTDGKAIDQVYEYLDRAQQAPGAPQAVAGNQPIPAAVAVAAPPAAPEGAPAANGVSETSPAAAPPAPPQTQRTTAGRSVGPTARRTNVVTVQPQAATAPTTAVEQVLAGQIPRKDAPAPLAPLEAAQEPDPGELKYLSDLRQGLREQTAILYRINVIIENLKAALEDKPQVALPTAEPHPASDKALADRIEADWPGRTLADLGADELTALSERFEVSLKKKRNLLAERGIDE